MRRTAFAFACTVVLSGPALGAAGDALTVVGDRVNVRAGPSTEREVMMQLSRNQPLIELARQGEWVHAEIAGAGGARGWIHASLVAPQGGEPPTPPAADGGAGQAEEPGAARATSPGPAAAAGDPAPLRPPEDATDAAAAAEPEPAAGAPGAGSLPEQAGARTSGPEAIAPGAALDLETLNLQRFRDSVAYLNSRSKSLAGVDLFTEVEPLGGGAVQVGATDAWADIPPAGQRSYANALVERWAAATGRADQLTVRIVDQGGQVIMEESRP